MQRRGVRLAARPLKTLRLLADLSEVPRRKPTDDELLDSLRYLYGRTVVNDGRTEGEPGEVIKVAVERGVATITVNFPRSGQKVLAVIPKRTPPSLIGESEAIRLSYGRQPSVYRWWPIDDVTSEPPPVACFDVSVDLQTATRMASARRRRTAKEFAELFATTLELVVEAGLDSAGDDHAFIRRRQTVVPANATWFRIRVTLLLFRWKDESARNAYGRLLYQLDGALNNDPSRWGAVFATGDQAHALATHFELAGTVGSDRLASQAGRLVLR